jgi:hypothetical protein
LKKRALPQPPTAKDLFIKLPSEQEQLALAWEYSRLWPEVFERYRIRNAATGIQEASKTPPSEVLPMWAMTFVGSPHWPKKTYLDLTLPQRIEAFPNAPCFQKKIGNHPYLKALRFPKRRVLLPQAIKVFDPSSDNSWEKDIFYQAIVVPRHNAQLLLLDMTFPREQLEQEFQKILELEKPVEASSSKTMLSSLAIYKALRAGWSPSKAVRVYGARKVINEKAMYFLWCRAHKIPLTNPVNESIVPVQERRHRLSYARKVPKFFKALFNHEKNKIEITKGPFFTQFNIA